MTTTPSAVLVIETSPSWHTHVSCTALDTAVLAAAGSRAKIREIDPQDAASRPPCLVCATPPTTEWTVTADTVLELWELIGPSKPYVTYNPETNRMEAEGLTIWEHGGVPRTVARFGDTIRLHNGLYRVTHAATALEG